MKKVIIIFGFSGSGKSTLANLLGKEYGLRIVHPSGILRNLLEGKKINIKDTKYNKGFWESQKGINLFKSRLNDEEPLDIISDRILLKEVEKGEVVIDSWSLPWLTNKGIKIYLKADLKVRANRVSKRNKISYNQALEIISMKDEETRRLFKRIYRFDIKKEFKVFDLIINTNNLNLKKVFDRTCNYLGELFLKTG